MEKVSHVKSTLAFLKARLATFDPGKVTKNNSSIFEYPIGAVFDSGSL